MKKMVLTAIALSVVLLFIGTKITNLESFYSTMGGAAIGFLGSLFVYQVGSYVDERAKRAVRRENTIHIFQLYKYELEMNSKHIEDLIGKKWIPFYKLKSITRDSLWGELTDYSRDSNLMRKLNYVYGEFELINNKIDIMNAARLAKISCLREEDRSTHEEEIHSQLAGVIDLGTKVLPQVNESLEMVDRLIAESK